MKNNIHKWTVDDSRANIVIVHGFAEHSGRYEEWAQELNNANISVYTFDLIGHGKHPGRTSYIHRFDDYLDQLADFLQSEVPSDKPLFLFGHSMGGLIVTKYGIDRNMDNIMGIICSAAANKVSEDLAPFLQKMSGFLGKCFPTMRTIPLPQDTLSRDPDHLKNYNEDPLVYKGNMYARTGMEILNATKYVNRRFEKLETPVLILHGSADKLTSPNGSKEFYQKSSSEDKSLKIYDGLYHELIFEPERKQVRKDILDWIKDRI